LTAARSDNVGALQTIILISDGVPYCVDNCDWGGCFGAIRTEAYDYAQYAVDDEHISIFPVSFYDPDGMSLDSDSCSDVDTAKDDQSAFMESLGAEFETGYGEFFETTDADELTEILEVIGRTVPVALVE